MVDFSKLISGFSTNSLQVFAAFSFVWFLSTGQLLARVVASHVANLLSNICVDICLVCAPIAFLVFGVRRFLVFAPFTLFDCSTLQVMTTNGLVCSVSITSLHGIFSVYHVRLTVLNATAFGNVTLVLKAESGI